MASELHGELMPEGLPGLSHLKEGRPVPDIGYLQ